MNGCQGQVLARVGLSSEQLDNRGSYGRGHNFESARLPQFRTHELEDQRTGTLASC